VKRFVLGTVQLGQAYGRVAGGPPVEVREAFAVLDRAWALGIRCFDTAEAYGASIERLAGWMDARGVRAEAQIVTKARVADTAAIPERLQRALGAFGGTSALTLLSHGPASGEVWRQLVVAAERAAADAGQSVYEAAEVRAAVALPAVRRVQAPGNLFDRAALEARAGASIPLDLRSVYLQGVLLEPEAAADRRAPGTGRLATAVAAAAADEGLAPAALLVAAMLRELADGDRLVVGVDRPDELDALVLALRVDPAAVERFALRATKRAGGPIPRLLLDPRTWPRP
jgi:aryl-alcohol dehydrogenase-like predicted oxidoreductase